MSNRGRFVLSRRLRSKAMDTVLLSRSCQGIAGADSQPSADGTLLLMPEPLGPRTNSRPRPWMVPVDVSTRQDGLKKNMGNVLSCRSHPSRHPMNLHALACSPPVSPWRSETVTAMRHLQPGRASGARSGTGLGINHHFVPIVLALGHNGRPLSPWRVPAPMRARGRLRWQPKDLLSPRPTVGHRNDRHAP